VVAVEEAFLVWVCWDMFVYSLCMQRFICAFVVYYYIICLKKDILYMCKTWIQIKNGGKSHEKSVYHKLVSTKIVFPIRC
jgi:hypothetical protein